MADEASNLDGQLFQPGLRVAGRYVLQRELGRGAGGVVWLAFHEVLATQVAIKFLDAADAQDPMRAQHVTERFRFEAQVSARLAPRTKRIVAVHDAAAFRGVPYLVMEFVEGESLEAHVDRAPLAAVVIADMLDHVAEALTEAHELGIAHRDVKPGNILVASAGDKTSYKLADFGVAKLLGEPAAGLTVPRRTAEHTLVGSPAYMSPEAASAAPATDGSADLWALAVTAYESLTQRLPFDGAGLPQVLVAILSGKFAPPSSVMSGLPSALDDVFRKAFSLDPSARYKTAREFAVAFREALEEPLALVHESLQATRPMAARGAPSRTPSLDAERSSRTLRGVAGDTHSSASKVALTPATNLESAPAMVPPEKRRRAPLVWLLVASLALVLAVGIGVRSRGQGTAAAVSNHEDSAAPRSDATASTAPRAPQITTSPQTRVDSATPSSSIATPSSAQRTARASITATGPASATTSAVATASTPATSTATGGGGSVGAQTTSTTPAKRPVDKSEVQ
ncbi:MAG: protein kinase [Polyangiaceae bacterium]